MSIIDDNNGQQCVGGEETSNTKVNTPCAQNNIDTITEGIDSAAILDDTSTCANCGKKGITDNMNTCNKCKEVKYCNAACKKKHRSKHKKACERRVAELHEEALFKEVEPQECPICLLPMPIRGEHTTTESCCGKRICNGCIHAMKESEGKDICAFCRTPTPYTDAEEIERAKKLIGKGNAEACYLLAGYYDQGIRGVPQDHQKANELFLKAGELGSAGAYFNLGFVHDNGNGVQVDKKKGQYYYELAAMMGHVSARHNLGCNEGQAGNYHRAMKHMMIAAKAGHEGSLKNVKEGFRKRIVTKDEYASTLRAYHERHKEMKSSERDKAVFLKMAGVW